jgi:BTB/POZ domain
MLMIMSFLKNLGFQEFKCHKLVLSLASSVFDAMLFGHFREAQLEPDEPILLDKVSPQAFRCAMK